MLEVNGIQLALLLSITQALSLHLKNVARPTYRLIVICCAAILSLNSASSYNIAGGAVAMALLACMTCCHRVCCGSSGTDSVAYMAATCRLCCVGKSCTDCR